MGKQPIPHLVTSAIGKRKYQPRFSRVQQGVTSIEYALITALITLVILSSVGSTGNAVLALWAYIENNVSEAVTKAPG